MFTFGQRPEKLVHGTLAHIEKRIVSYSFCHSLVLSVAGVFPFPFFPFLKPLLRILLQQKHQKKKNVELVFGPGQTTQPNFFSPFDSLLGLFLQHTT